MIALLVALLAVVPQDKPSPASDAAAKFSLDLSVGDKPASDPPQPSDQPAATLREVPVAGAAPQPAADLPLPGAAALATADPSAASPATFSLDTPIAALIADYRAKAVLDRDLPGLSTDENLDKFKAMSLRQFAPVTGGQLTSELMTRTAYDLAGITAGEATSSPAASRRARGR